ncbi:Leucine-rich repeat-containing protein [Plasmodiophora brassicae]
MGLHKVMVAPIHRQIHQAITEDRELRSLIVGDPCGPQSVRALATAITANFYTRLTRVSFWKAALTDSGVLALCGAIPNLHSLSILELVDADMTQASCAALGKALTDRNSPLLSTLRLDYNSLTSSGLASMSGALRRGACHRLACLSLGFCELDQQAGAILADVMTVPRCALKELNLEGNRLEDAGWEELSSGIRRNTSLAVINLSNNRFGNSSAAIEAFRDAFAENRSLQTIDIDGNLVGDAGAVVFTDMLHHCPHITEFKISSTVSPDLYRALKVVVHSHRGRPARHQDRPASKTKHARQQKNDDAKRKALIDEFLESQAMQRLELGSQRRC